MAGRANNALMEPRAAQQMPPEADMIMQLARQAGYQGNDLQEASEIAWEASPTDGVGEAITALARTGAIQPPGHPDTMGMSTDYQPYSAVARSRQRRRAYGDDGY
ncbi:MAG: hypothetical protein K2X43_01320 [Hyphomonadaceae bacterium]|jgi:hypothetical protein|nr:hypothetical protein [Hyphomonadaceae bacterium]